MSRFLVTGAAGFIGFHVSRRLLDQGATVVGLDNLNDYYSVQLKRDRLAILEQLPGFQFQECALEDARSINALFDTHPPDLVIHLAAQAGVRYSLTNPMAYVDSNLVGFVHILEACRHHATQHLVYASSIGIAIIMRLQAAHEWQRAGNGLAIAVCTNHRG